MKNLTVIAASLKDVPMGGQGAVLPKFLFKNQTINCLFIAETTRQPHKDSLCLFRATGLHLHGNPKLEEVNIWNFFFFMNRMDGLSSNQFQGVHVNDIPKVEDLLTLNFLLRDINSVVGNNIGELGRPSMQESESTVQLLRYNNQICHVSDINTVFQTNPCPICDVFVPEFGAPFIYMQWTSENVYPKNVYETRETLFDKLNSFEIEWTNEQMLFENIAKLDFNLFACKMKAPKTLKKQIELGDIMLSQSPFPQILSRNQFSHATPILIISLLLSSGPSNIQLSKVEQSWKLFSSISRQQWRINWVISCPNLPNVKFEEIKHVWLIATTRIVPPLSSYRSERSS